MPAMSLDLFAATNPALCSVILWYFARGYRSRDSEGVPLSAILLPLPIVLSQDLASSFKGTSSTTGLLGWINKTPEVTVGLADRVERTAGYARAGLIFGVRQRVFEITSDGRVLESKRGFLKQPNTRDSGELGRRMKLAECLGKWVAEVGSIGTTFACLGFGK